MVCKTTRGYVGWLLPAAERNRLLDLFPPLFETVVAHHCTLEFGVLSTTALPTDHTAQVIGESVDRSGVQALVLEIGGTQQRPTGGIFHITWSLANGRKPVQSNHVIRQQGWICCNPVTIALEPQFFSLKNG